MRDGYELLEAANGAILVEDHMNPSLNSLKGVLQGIIYNSTIGVIKGDTRSLDYCSHPAGLHHIPLGADCPRRGETSEQEKRESRVVMGCVLWILKLNWGRVYFPLFGDCISIISVCRVEILMRAYIQCPGIGVILN